MDDLRKLLKGQKQRWTSLEDIAVQDPQSQEFSVVENERGHDEIKKRKQFLEIE